MKFANRISAAVILVAGAALVLPLRSAQPTGEGFSPAQRQYWAFQPLSRPSIPEVKTSEWVKNPIDAFVAAKLEQKGLNPSPATDKVTLLRRVYFDLTGLPPTPEEVDAFLADSSPDAYAKVVDRLLDSPHYGERWARHWLDIARYAESDGFKADDLRPNVWRYRDYVIRAFNEDKPYDRFMQEQIAGDELWPGDFDARLATAFNRHYPDEYNQQNLKLRRQEILNDITDTVGSAFLGMTFECARCHDHKFDAILQADYYRLQAFFSNVAADDEIPLLPPAELEEYNRKVAAWEETTAGIRSEISMLVYNVRTKSYKSRYTAYVEEVQQALDTPVEQRTAMQRWMTHKARNFMNPADEDLAKGLRGSAKQCYQDLKVELDKFEHLHPGSLPIGVGITELSAEPLPTHVLSVGAYDRPLEEVQPGFLTILDPGPAKVTPPANGHTTGRRSALAKWLADPSNPLTPRVMANRIWNYHFGRGIAATPSDFGLMGERPTHPELLNWLSGEFIRSGWSMKHMHRLIVNSSTYQQSSAYNELAAKADPFNRLLWRYDRQRLEAEIIRDTTLKVSGLLNPEVYGPSVRPPLPLGVPDRSWETSPDVADHHRRSIYTFIQRNTLYPMVEVFDMPDTHASCARRSVTTTAPQALTFLNSTEVMDWAQAFAGRVLSTAGDDVSKQIEAAYRLAYSRRPKGTEKDAALTFFDRHAAIIAERAAAGEKLALPPEKPEWADPVHAAALVDFCHMLVNSNEFVYSN